METATVITAMIFQYVALWFFVCLYKALLKHVVVVSPYTWAGLFIPVFGIAVGIVQSARFLLK